MLPPIWQDAHLRNTTPICPNRNRMGLGFDIPGQGTVRIALTVPEAQALQEDLARYIKSRASIQSEGSALSPSELVRVPSEGVKT
jgi:hypothetical protein